MTPAENTAKMGALASRIGRPVTLMEVCGTHTMAAFRTGLRSLLPPNVKLLSGPGCPVCVTPNSYVDRAMAIARQPDTMVATFGDMLRVPGTGGTLERARAGGATVQVVYSPLDAVKYARENPGVRVVFLGVGFETTVPATAWALSEARRNVPNFLVFSAHKTMPNAMATLLRGGAVELDGFLCPGHVSVIIGSDAYESICQDFSIPCVVAGFEGADMLAGVEMLLQQIVERRAQVEIQYTRSVSPGGNPKAQAMIRDVFEECEAEWRGLGVIPHSGLRIREAFAAHDAARVFADLEVPGSVEAPGCLCGDVLRGARTPVECPLFRSKCTPDHPVGACMVSSEGACSAYFKYA